ncbi:MAG: glycosyltransferase family 2 protein [Bacteroidaceae bacterium]|nr:glycosyltransferase family 2 protein [Bacteroidaceae bacterium]
MRLIALIPTYNNATTVCGVVRRTLAVCHDVMVVDDGSTDDTLQRLRQELPAGSFHLVTYPANRGKGGALRAGISEARRLHFTHVLTLDADGQHYPEDAPRLIEASREHPEAIIVGTRSFADGNMPGGSRFANRFSNFWFAVQTLRRLPDTQTGFRIYPLATTGGLRTLTSRYEAELELLVLSAWRGTPILPIGVRVFYPAPSERVSHFRPRADFLRITVLNTVLCFLAVGYGWPRMLITAISRRLRAATRRPGTGTEPQ